MGHNVISSSAEDVTASLPPWLDAASRALVADLVATLAARWPDLLAVILYGSIARHDERPLDDAQPSDVDLLAVFSTDDALITVHRGLAVSATLEPAYERHLDTPRDVQLLLASRDLREWDPTFVANVGGDGRVLFARGALPPALADMSPLDVVEH